MKRNEILRDLMFRRHLCIADLVKITGIPYTTIKSILENGVERSSYSYICSICSALGITADELEELAGAIPQGSVSMKTLQIDLKDFTEEEITKVQHYLNFLRYSRDNKG